MQDTESDSPDSSAPAPVSLCRSAWSNRALIGGITYMAMLRLISPLVGSIGISIPFAIAAPLALLAAQGFEAVFPLMTRRQLPAGTIRLPTFKSCLTEFALAVPVLFGFLVIETALLPLLAELLPGTGVGEQKILQMAQSPYNSWAVAYLAVMLLSAAVAEEIFFRGFLFTAFRQRLGLTIAMALQSVLFGLMHFYGPAATIHVILCGMICGCMYVWRQTILSPIIIHIGVNTVSLIGMVFAMQAADNTPTMGIRCAALDARATITFIIPNSPADRSGMKVGDTITVVGEYAAIDFEMLLDAVRCYDPGDTVTVKFLRDGDTWETDVTFIPRKVLMQNQSSSNESKL